MDPNTCLFALLSALADLSQAHANPEADEWAEREDVLILLESLALWLQSGGFPPTNVHVIDQTAIVTKG